VDVTSQEIRLSSDGGKSFPTTIAGGVSGSAGLFDWAVPASIAPTRTAVIRVTAADAAGNQQFAQSDSLTVIGSGFSPNTTVNLSYDVLNRITRAAYSDGRSIAYTYDSSGNLVEITVSGQ
jgi:YD repeat-containing protein